MNKYKDSDKTLSKAVDFLLAGKLVSIMTETVYGLAGDASNLSAINKIYEIKNRPKKNPLIVHVNSIKMAKEICYFNQIAEIIASKYWPGPITLILKKKKSKKVISEVTAGMETIAVRMPNSKIFLELINKLNKPIAAPSANISGYISSTNADHVRDSFGDNIDLIVDSGKSYYGLESTVLNLTSKPYFIERPGIIDEKKILKDTNINFFVRKKIDNQVIISPGQILKHYSPNKSLRLNVLKPDRNEAYLAFGKSSIKPSKFCLNLSINGDLNQAAHNLFDYLRKLDNVKKEKIAVSPIPLIGIGRTINERLVRASFDG